jgi:hypothetical protein
MGKKRTEDADDDGPEADVVEESTEGTQGAPEPVTGPVTSAPDAPPAREPPAPPPAPARAEDLPPKGTITLVLDSPRMVRGKGLKPGYLLAIVELNPELLPEDLNKILLGRQARIRVV